jgi:predicted transcriptional regulator
VLSADQQTARSRRGDVAASRAKITSGALVHMAHLAVAFLWRFSGASLSLPWRLLAAPDRAVLAIARRQDYIARMDTAPRPGDRADTLSPETEAERQRRLAWEAEGIAEARADVAAGRLVDAAKVRAWVDSLRTDNPLPVPYSGR